MIIFSSLGSPSGSPSSPPAHQDGGTPGRAGRRMSRIKEIKKNEQVMMQQVMANYVCVT